MAIFGVACKVKWVERKEEMLKRGFYTQLLVRRSQMTPVQDMNWRYATLQSHERGSEARRTGIYGQNKTPRKTFGGHLAF